MTQHSRADDRPELAKFFVCDGLVGEAAFDAAGCFNVERLSLQARIFGVGWSLGVTWEKVRH